MEEAISSPSEMTSILSESRKESAMEIIIKSAGILSIDEYIPEKPPIENAEYDAIVSGSKELIVLITALKSAFTATPERIREIDDDTLFVKDEIKNTMETEMMAPRNAAKGKMANISGVRERKRRTDAPAPEFTPIMFGLESPFPVAF